MAPRPRSRRTGATWWCRRSGSELNDRGQRITRRPAPATGAGRRVSGRLGRPISASGPRSLPRAAWPRRLARMRRNRTRAAILSVLMPTVLAAWTPPPPLHTEVAPGVHLFQTQPYGDVGLDGNSVAIVGDDG